MGCCLGGDDDKEASMKKANESTPLNKADKGSSKIQFETGTHKLKLPFFVQTPIIKKNNNEIILFYTERKVTKYSILNINDCKVTETVEVKCDSDDFDVFNTVYALNENDNKVYFIENNTNILTLDLNENGNEIVSLNKTITTNNNNYASIIYNDATKKLYVFGAEEKSDEDDNYELVPYSTLTRYVDKGKGIEPKIKGFGQYSRLLNINREGTDYIYICGGLSTKGQAQPDDVMLIYDIKTKQLVSKFTAQPMVREGIINYNDQYIVTFGGTVMRNKKVHDPANFIFVLPLTDNNKGYEVKVNEWYLLSKKLSVKGKTPKSEGKLYFNAVIIDGIVHLVSYNGKYYTMKMKDILDEIDIGKKMDQSQGLIHLQACTEQGKTTTPSKALTITNMGPKEDK